MPSIIQRELAAVSGYLEAEAITIVLLQEFVCNQESG